MKNHRKDSSLQSLQQKYKVSERTIRNDVAEINEFLRNLHISDIYLDTEGILNTGPDFDADAVERELIEMDTYLYKLSPGERQIYISLLLLWNHKHIVMKHIADELYVSRITILNDFDSIKESLEQKNIKVIADTGKGVYVRCSRMQRVEQLSELMQSLMLDVENEGFFQRFVLKQLQIKYTFSDICIYAQQYLSINNLVFIDDALYATVLYFFIVFNLISSHEKTTTMRDMDFNEIDNLMMYIAYKLNIIITEEMLLDFRDYIHRHDISLYIKTLDEIELYEIITHFLSNIDQEMALNLSQDHTLISSLLLHIKNMRDWGDLEFEFSKMDEMVLDYHKLLDTVDQNLYVLEKYLSYTINENMKKSIMIHICVALIRGNEKSEKPSVVIVCPGSMATGKYLEAQIKNYFDFNILGLYPALRISNQLENMKNVDFIISTVQLYDISCRCLKVHAVLTMQDMNLIQKTAFEYQSRKSTYKKKEKKDIVVSMQQYQGLPDPLFKKIESLIREYSVETHNVNKTAIGELLEEDAMIFDEDKQDWEEAIRAAGTILIQKESIGPDFIEKAIQNIKDYGDYIILGNGVALAHAGKNYGVYRDSLSLLVSHSGITFSETETKVHFLFCFSSRGVNDHIELFQEIVKIGQEEAYRSQLLEMSKKQLYEALCYQ